MAGTSTPNGPRPTGRKLANAARTEGASKPSRGRSRATTPAAATAGTRGAPSAVKKGRKPKKGGAAATRPGGKRRRINYPRAGKGPIRRWIPSWRFFLGGFLLCIVGALLAFIVAYNVIKVPAPNEFAQAQSTTVYYADGTTKMGTFAQVNRTIIDTSKLPSYVGKAVVASEDRSFYSNNGVDPKGIARAFVNNLAGGATQGGSTLTQQYIKNYYVDTTSSYVGKFKQAIMAIKIDREMSKDDILDSYLNTVYFGRGAYGIQAASQAFFGHDASELTVSEAALLAGIMPAPSAWDPAIDAKQAELRFKRVLNFMLEDGYITQEQHDSAAMPETIQDQTNEVYAGANGYLLQYVRTELKEQAGLSGEQIDTGGYKIVTTIKKDAQDAAVAAVQALPEGASPNLHTALVSIDPSTGGVVAMYGGADYLKSQVNAATDAVAQAGSTFKPFALIGALENGDTLSNGYEGNSPMDIDGTTFKNAGSVSYGWVDLIKATQNSVNTAYVQLNRDLGPEVTNKVAIRAGYPEKTLGLDSTIQNVLGSASPHTLDIATAYATFASGGTRHETHIVSQVTNSAGDVAYTANTTGKKVFSDDVMADATYAMQQVVNAGTGTVAKEIGRPVAAKTGSSSDNKSAQFAGFTPNLATAVTMYQSGDDGSEQSITPWGRYSEITGGTYPGEVFTAYMKAALASMPVVDFPSRTPQSYVKGSLTGTPAPAELASRRAVETEAPAEPVEEATQAPAEPQNTAPTQSTSDGGNSGGAGTPVNPGNSSGGGGSNSGSGGSNSGGNTGGGSSGSGGSGGSDGAAGGGGSGQGGTGGSN